MVTSGGIYGAGVRRAPGAHREPASTVRVTRGASLWKIARSAGCTVDALVAANVDRYPSLATRPDALKVNWLLRLPGSAGSGSEAPSLVASPGADARPTVPWESPGEARPRPSRAGEGERPEGATAAVRLESRTPPAPSEGGLAPATFAPAQSARMAMSGFASLEDATRRHREAIRETGVGVYYGSNSEFGRLGAPSQRSPNRKQRAWLSEAALPGASPPERLRRSNCMEWPLEHLAAAYAAVGKSERWAVIEAAVRADKLRGTTLARLLAEDGWVGIYYNPDTSNRSEGGMHSGSARWSSYFGTPVGDRILDYRRPGHEGEAAAKIAHLDRIPFFFGVAEHGTHAFAGRYGKVSELHYKYDPDNPLLMEETKLRSWNWDSGLIMVPPHSWKFD